MDFTYDPSGTERQASWFQEAVAACTYPLITISANVTVVWGSFPSDLDSKHPYMVTVPDGAGAFTIYVAPWADDPTNPNLQGLPSPTADVENFYKASVTHELGHVVSFSTYDPGDEGTGAGVAEMCGLFETPEVGNGGRRTGTAADYDASGLTWSQEIREAVAEWFKLAFCPTPTVFWNRSNWNVDQNNWAALCTLIGAGGTGSYGPEVTVGTTTVTGFTLDSDETDTIYPGGEDEYPEGIGVSGGYYYATCPIPAPDGNIPPLSITSFRYTIASAPYGGDPFTYEIGGWMDDSYSNVNGYIAAPALTWFGSDGGVNGDPATSQEYTATSGDSTETASGAWPWSTGDGYVSIVSVWMGLQTVAEGVPVADDPGVMDGTTLSVTSTYEPWVPASDVPYPSRSGPTKITAKPGLRGAVAQSDIGIHGRLPVGRAQINVAASAAATKQSKVTRGMTASPKMALRGAVKIN